MIKKKCKDLKSFSETFDNAYLSHVYSKIYQTFKININVLKLLKLDYICQFNYKI